MSAHTPGPWSVETVDFGDLKQVDTITSPTVSVGSYERFNGSRHFPVVSAGGISGRSAAECDANAKLIAAAPDLLAACRSALAFMRGDRPSNGIVSVDAMLNRLVRAIQNAEPSI